MKPIITCEHAGNQVPGEFNYLFEENKNVLNTHRGWDPGAYDAAIHIASSIDVPLHYNLITRLLIEFNRSRHHPDLFSAFSNRLNDQVKSDLIELLYIPYRKKIEEEIALSNESVLHLSIHSFAPVLNNEIRELEIGLLFDPHRKSELVFCEEFKEKLSEQLPELRIVFNEPYKGVDDGFTTYLRTKFPDEHYRGIEIELNQKMIGTSDWQKTKEELAAVLRTFIH